MAILELNNVKKTFGTGHKQVDALKETNFSAEPGELIAVIGPSGSGKSTFLTVAGGLQTPTSGGILVNNKDLADLNEKQRSKVRLKEIGFILQASNLVPFLNVDNQMKLLDNVKKDNMTKRNWMRYTIILALKNYAKNIPPIYLVVNVNVSPLLKPYIVNLPFFSQMSLPHL